MYYQKKIKLHSITCKIQLEILYLILLNNYSFQFKEHFVGILHTLKVHVLIKWNFVKGSRRKWSHEPILPVFNIKWKVYNVAKFCSPQRFSSSSILISTERRTDISRSIENHIRVRPQANNIYLSPKYLLNIQTITRYFKKA